MNFERLRQLADDMQDAIDHKMGTRKENTPKRQREGMSARIDGRHLQRIQAALRALATAREAGAVPVILEKLTTKSAIAPLVRKQLESGGYYHIAETDEWSDNGAQAIALRMLMENKETPEQKAAREEQAKQHAIQEMENEIKFAKIPGFFPTPADIVGRLIYEANIEPGQLVLEPSAGKGDIAEAIRAEGVEPHCIEQNFSLVQILCAKGFEVDQAGDFMEHTPQARFDAVIMNPPFENGQDADHVMHAYKFLKPGGRLVAVTGAGIFFRTDRKATAFREWLAENDGTSEDLPEDAFKSGFVPTGVRTKLVCVTKPDDVQPEEVEFAASTLRTVARFTAADFQSFLFNN